MNAINTIPETISVLETYNKWRRGDETIPQPEPFEIGGAIDVAVRLLRELTAERAIVSRIWVQLGSPTYADLKGRSIYDLIDEIKTDRAEVEKWQSVAAQMSAEREHNANEASRLRADLERFTGHGLLDCHAICDQRDAAMSVAQKATDELACEKENRNHLIEKGAKLETELAAMKAEFEKIILLAAQAADRNVELRRLAEKAEAELVAAKAECNRLYESSPTALDALTAELARLRAEVERLKGLASWANTCIHHNDAERARYGHVCLVCTSTRAEKAEAEVERLTKQIKDDNRSYGCELRDPNGTIWEQAAKDHARAERAEAELTRLRADNLTAHQMACAAGLERDQLRAEVERLDVEKPWLKEANARAAHAEAEIERWRDSNNRLRAEMESQAQRAERAEKLKKLWREFITLMEITEESDSGNKFNPNKISSCRALDGRKLNEILVEARKIVF